MKILQNKVLNNHKSSKLFLISFLLPINKKLRLKPLRNMKVMLMRSGMQSLSILRHILKGMRPLLSVINWKWDYLMLPNLEPLGLDL